MILHRATQIVEGTGGSQILVQGGDAPHDRAVGAGRALLHPRTDEPWGTRDATVLAPGGKADT